MLHNGKPIKFTVISKAWKNNVATCGCCGNTVRIKEAFWEEESGIVNLYLGKNLEEDWLWGTCKKCLPHRHLDPEIQFYIHMSWEL